MSESIVYDILAVVHKKKTDAHGRTIKDENRNIIWEKKLCTITLCANTVEDAKEKLEKFYKNIEKIVSINICQQLEPDDSPQMAVNE